MKRGLVLLLSLLLLVSGCASKPAENEVEPEATPGVSGTFTGTAFGMKSDITVDVELAEGEIKTVTVTAQDDSEGIAEVALEEIPAAIVATQNLDVDNTSGATMTSLGIKNAVAAALESAEVNVDDYRKGAPEVAKTEKEAETVDVVVAGSGFAGLSAAIEIARKTDLKVTLVEQNAYTGGSSRVCGGGIWVVGSKYNKEIGVDSTAQDMYDFYKTHSEFPEGQEPNLALLENIHDCSADIFEYYVDNGFPLNMDSYGLGHKESQLPMFNSKYGNDNPWETGETRLIASITDIAEKEGVDIRLNTKMTEILSEGNVVSGIRVEDKEGTYNINAGKVILATGGFSRNPELVAKYAPEFKAGIPFTGAGTTGDGLILTEKFGTKIVGGGMMGLVGYNANYGYYHKEGGLAGGSTIIVNAEGKDFDIRGVFYAERLKKVIDQTGSEAFGIYDSTYEDMPRLEDALAKGVVSKYETLDELAADMKIDAENLKATAVEKELKEGPYYGIHVRPLFIGSIPGLEVDETCHVLNGEGQPVENLFACGELIFGNVYSGHYPASGSGVGISAYSGGVAGMTAAAEIAK